MKHILYNKPGGGAGATRTIYVEVPVPVEPGDNELYEGIFGDGANGDIVFTNNATLTQDLSYNNMTIQSGRTITLGWVASEGRPARLRVNGTLRFEGQTANISVAGGPASAPTGGYDGNQGGDGYGANGVSTINTDGLPSPNITAPSIGSRGMPGLKGFGVGAPPALGQGGVAGTINLVVFNGSNPGDWDDLVACEVGGVPLAGGSGGGSGGNGAGAAVSGGGGGAGGVLYVAARHITEDAPIPPNATNYRFNADGGQLSASNAGNTGANYGGQGGAGGIIVICEDLPITINFTAAPAPYYAASSGIPAFGHIYLASLFTGQNEYDIPFRGQYHPIRLVPPGP